MNYTPLRQSKLWRSAHEAAAEYYSLYPTVLDSLTTRFLSAGTGYDWQNGALVSSDSNDFSETFDAPWKPPSVRLPFPADPGDNPLFSAVPIVPDYANFYQGRIMALSEGYLQLKEMPFDTDIHHLAAALIILKDLHLNPGKIGFYANKSIDKRQREKQKALVSSLIALCLENVEERGLQTEFAKSCAEFEHALPDLCALTKEHATWQDQKQKLEEQITTITEKFKNMTPGDREKVMRLVNGGAAGVKPQGPA